MKKSIILALSALLAASVSATAQEVPARIKDAGKLVIATMPNYPPITYKDPATNELQGFDIDLGESIAKGLGVKAQWEEIAFAQMLPSLQTARVDMVLAGMSDTVARQETADFVDYLKSGAQFYTSAAPLAADLASGFPFKLHHLHAESEFAPAARQQPFDYVLLFESSGMYRGEETVPLLAQLTTGRLDAVWGSRRLSVRDIEESYRFRYSASALQGAVSFLGSHALSLICLLCYGRYISDTLSGVRAIRAEDVLAPDVDLTHKNANHVLLSRLLRRKADIVEMPVRFVPLSPDRVKRTSALDGISALATLVRHRFTRLRTPSNVGSYPSESATASRPSQ